jgi:hypothetical protein
VRRNYLRDDVDLADARAVARAAVDSRYLVWLHLSMAVLFVGDMLVTWSATAAVLYAVVATANAVAGVARNWYVIRAEVFLDECPTETVH